MTLLPLFKWLAASPVGQYMQSSTWAFAIVEMVHLIALALVGGTVLMVDLAALGLRLPKQRVADIAASTEPFFGGGVLVMILSGILLVSEEALKCYYSAAFQIKMLLLALAISFHFARRAWLRRLEPAPRLTWKLRLSGVLSLSLWLGIGLAGRAIGLL